MYEAEQCRRLRQFFESSIRRRELRAVAQEHHLEVLLGLVVALPGLKQRDFVVDMGIHEELEVHELDVGFVQGVILQGALEKVNRWVALYSELLCNILILLSIDLPEVDPCFLFVVLGIGLLQRARDLPGVGAPRHIEVN